MKIIVNGKELKIKDQLTIEKLLEELKVQEKVMAVAVNMNIVKQEKWSQYHIQPNDKIELLHFVGGG